MRRSPLSLIRVFGLICLTVMALFSCQKQEDETIPVLKIQSTVFQPEGSITVIELAATSSWTLTAEYTGEDKDWVHFSKSSGESGIHSLHMTVDKNSAEGTRKATITVKGITLSKSVDISQLGTGAPADVPLWLELPKVTVKNNYFFGTHDLSGGTYVSNQTSGTRNYSFYWNKEGLVSDWVAYPLNKSLCGTGNYNYNWAEAFDPMLPSSWYQPDITSYSYGGKCWSEGNWNRGHLMARADRQLTQESVTSTCRVTNIAPQDSQYNSGIWGDLENKVRNSWAKASSTDTLYVVVGCDQSGSDKYSERERVKVPSAFYKALLLRKKNGEYSMCAFYIPHTKTAYDTGVFQGDFMDYKISVAELEAKTGYSYFDNLAYIAGMTEEKIRELKNNAANW